ncbi:MAG: hypothetical protein AAGF73_17575 [Actinomycetota bacterium]
MTPDTSITYSATNLRSSGPTGFFEQIYKLTNPLPANPQRRARCLRCSRQPAATGRLTIGPATYADTTLVCLAAIRTHR